jgi:hypothetical protein
MEKELMQGEGRAADFTVPSGCATCGGDVQVRRTPGHKAGVVCLSCRAISHPFVQSVTGGLVFHNVLKASA